MRRARSRSGPPSERTGNAFFCESPASAAGRWSLVEGRRSRTRPLTVVLLLVCAAALLRAQSPAPGALSGRLTNLRSEPLTGVTVILRNQATGADFRATTGRKGAYRFRSLPPGDYTLQAESPKLGRGTLRDIEVEPGAETRIQTAMRFRLSAPRRLKLPARRLSVPGPALVAAPLAVMLPRRPLQAMALPFRPAPSAAPPLVPLLSAAPPAPLPIQPLYRLPLTALVVPAEPPAPQVLTNALVATEPVATEPSQPAVPPIAVAAEQPNPATAAVTTTMTADQLQSLPASGGHWQQFVMDTPTASTEAGGSSPTSLRGAADEPAGATIDGVSTRLAFGSASSGISRISRVSGDGPNRMGQAWGGRGTVISQAAIREVQTVAGNVAAKASHAAGGRVNVTTESGSNQLHGQAYFFDRQNAWGAKNPFTEWVKETTPATSVTTPVFTPEPYTPPDHETNWGLGAGGRILRNKLFWFGALDNSHRNDPGLAVVRHPEYFFAQPSSDQMQVLSARLELSSVNPVVEGLGAYSKMLETLAGLLGPAPRTSAEWVGFGRIDWKAAERNTFTIEGIGATWNAPGGGLRGVAEAYGNHSFGSSQANQQWLLARWERFVTPNLLAVTQASVGHAERTARPETPSPFEQTLDQNVWGQLPQIIVDSRYGFTIGNPTRFGQGSYPTERIYSAQQMIDWAHNNLLVKAGFQLSHNADSTSLLRNQTGRYYYSTVANFVSDALAFGKFGLSGLMNPASPHGCDETGRVWRDSAGKLRGLGNLPCYSYYSQTMGPTNWYLSTNDWAGFATAQWHPNKLMVLSAGMRWEREQMPPPIARLVNPDLPLAEKLPHLGNNWGPRLAVAFGRREGRWPLLRLGYGLYYGRTRNATLETVLTQSGSPRGDLNFFIRPTDGFNPFTATSAAPLFPYVLEGEPLNVVKPSAVEFAPNFRNPEVSQAVASIEERLPGRLHLSASALLSLGRRLPIAIDTNFDTSINPKTITYAVVDGTGKGPIKTPQITVPFYAAWPAPTGATGRLNTNYQQISKIESRANSTYEAAVVRLSRYGYHGLSFSLHYTYAHAADWNPDESTYLGGSGVLDPANFSMEYGTSSLDVRHSGGAMLAYTAPWKLRGYAGRVANGWRIFGIGYFRSGLPFTMRTSGSLVKEFTVGGQEIVALGPGMNGSGGDNRVYGVGRNTYRYPWTWKADMRLGKSFNLGHMRRLELMAESFNLFNHRNITRLETTGYYISPGTATGGFPTMTFLTGLKANTTAFDEPLDVNSTSFYRERQIELGLRMKF